MRLSPLYECNSENIITPSQDEIKRILVDMLQDINEFCIAHNIKYFIMYGTLLGAIRHKGFIPWDDDIDICMPRDDYEYFVRNYVSEKEFSVKTIQNTKGYPYAYAKLSYDNSITIEKLYKPYKIGIYIDLFPLDKYGENSRCDSKKAKFYRRVSKVKSYRLSGLRSLGKNVELLFSKVFVLFISLKRINEYINNLATGDKNNQTEYVCNIVGGEYGSKEILKSQWFDNSKNVMFEGITVNAPADYDAILKQIYGDYLQLPKEEDRKSHHDSDYFLIKKSKNN